MSNVSPIPESILLLALLKDSAGLIKETSRKIKEYEKSVTTMMGKLSPEQKQWVEGQWREWSEKNLKNDQNSA